MHFARTLDQILAFLEGRIPGPEIQPHLWLLRQRVKVVLSAENYGVFPEAAALWRSDLLTRRG
jgi:hypothetical protein